MPPDLPTAATSAAPPVMDAAFLSLPLDAVADAALSRARRLGAAHADLRCERVRSAGLLLRDARPQGADDRVECGVGVRVVWDGAWGFASGVAVTPGAAARLADRAVEMARISRPLCDGRVELAPEPVVPDGRWVSPYAVNPFDVPEAARRERLAAWSARLLRAPGVDHVYAKLRLAQENKFYADLAGTRTLQQRVRLYPQLTAVAVDAGDGGFASQRTVGPPAARGWEYLDGEGWDWEAELDGLPVWLGEQARAPAVQPGSYDLVIDPSNLWLTLHETVGHATELDRVLGYEAAFAGGSFATFEGLGSMRYGSPAMQVTADRTAPHALATVAWDDEGVPAQRWELVRDGVLVGFQLDRRMARLKGFARSNGCAYADGPGHPALQRMPNVSLRPAPGGPSTAELIAGVDRGVYVVGDRSWSIDAMRRDFHFTPQRTYRIEHGRLAGPVRHAAYQGTTPEFWASLEAVGGPQTYGLFGADYCGKAQPLQIAAAGHGSPAALFRGVRVVSTAAGAPP